MKKNGIVVLTLVLALALFCAACGGGAKEPAPTEQPAAATELPTVTKPPEGESGADDVLTSDDNAAPAFRDHELDLASMSETQRKVEEELIGATVEDLYAAIGQPKSSDYAASCLVADGEDGILHYDGFIVSTTRWPSGDERVMGTDAE